MSSSSTSDDERMTDSADEGSEDSSESGDDFEAGIELCQFEPERPCGEEDLENNMNKRLPTSLTRAGSSKFLN